MKKISILLLSAFVLLISCFCSLPVSANTELYQQCKEMADLIASNLSQFKIEYNLSESKKMTSTEIEGYIPTYIIDAEKNGVYIDFNDSTGYMVATLDYEIYALEVEGDLEYLKNVDFVYYSVMDGFLYLSEDKYQKFDIELRSVPVEYGYSGQTGSGDGKITNISSYVSDRYPSYNFVEEHIDLSGFGYTHITQLATSYYVFYESQNHKGEPFTISPENNCAMVACCNLLWNWQSKGLISGIPTIDKTIDVFSTINEDPYYAKYGMYRPGPNTVYTWTINDKSILQNFSELYARARRYGAITRGTAPDQGINLDLARDILIYCMAFYQCLNYPTATTNFADVMNSLDNGYAVFCGLANSQTYGTHAVTLLGYRKYTYTTGVWIFQKTHTAYFYYIDDGRGNICYFDPNASSSLSLEYIYF